MGAAIVGKFTAGKFKAGGAHVVHVVRVAGFDQGAVCGGFNGGNQQGDAGVCGVGINLSNGGQHESVLSGWGWVGVQFYAGALAVVALWLSLDALL